MNLIDLKVKCEKSGKVTDSDWDQAQSRFKILGNMFDPLDSNLFTEEVKAFNEIMEVKEKGYVGYW